MDDIDKCYTCKYILACETSVGIIYVCKRRKRGAFNEDCKIYKYEVKQKSKMSERNIRSKFRCVNPLCNAVFIQLKNEPKYEFEHTLICPNCGKELNSITEYHCDLCDTDFDLNYIQEISPIVCPKCNNKGVHQELIFKQN